MKRTKLLSFLLAILLLVCRVAPAYAVNLNDCEIDDQVADIMRSYDIDPEGTIDALASIDIELISEPTSVEYYSEGVSRRTYPSNYTLSVYSYKKAGSSVISLQWLLVAHSAESSPGPLDYVSLEWDTAYAYYYSSSGDGNASTVQGQNTGIVVFNLEDNQLNAEDSAYGTVRVYRDASGWLNFGSSFVHTYTEQNASGSSTFVFKPSIQVSEEKGIGLGLDYTYSYTVNTSSVTTQWTLWTDNAVSLSLIISFCHSYLPLRSNLWISRKTSPQQERPPICPRTSLPPSFILPVRPYQNGSPGFPILKDTTIKTHAYDTSNNQILEVNPMKRLMSCEYNFDNCCVELKFTDGSMIAIDTIAVENEVARNLYERSELDYLVYNAPLEYADLILNGDPEAYLKAVTEYKHLD